MTDTPRKNVIMGSFKADWSLHKWQLIQERDRLFDSYCEALEKQMKWEADGINMAQGMSHETKRAGLNKMKAIIAKTMGELSARLIELDEQINDLGFNEPPDALTSQDDPS